MSINSINGSVSLGVPPQVDEEGNVITQDPDSDIKDPSAIQTDKVNTPDSETIDEDIAFKGSIQFRFALYQLNYANQCRQNAVNYMGQIEQVQDQAEEAAEMITKARDAEAKGSGVPAEVVSYMKTHKLGMKGSASSCSSDDWSYNLASLTQYQESISSQTQTLMVYLQDFISQYNSYLQGANAAVQESASTMRAILTGR